MGLFKRKPAQPARETVRIPLRTDEPTIVVGTSFRQDGFRGHRPGDAIFGIRREPGNKHDRNAVQVTLDDKPVGYISADRAVMYAPVFDDLEQRVLCTVEGYIEPYDGGLGARIFLPPPEVLRRWADPATGHLVDVANAGTVRLKRLGDYTDTHRRILNGANRADVQALCYGYPADRGKYKGQTCLAFAVDQQIVGILQAQYRNEAPGLFDRISAGATEQVTLRIQRWEERWEGEQPVSVTFFYAG